MENNNSNSVKKKHIIFIGAGITNLACAYKLSKSGYSITFIEKEVFNGGLSATHDWDGWKFDFGTHNFFSHKPEIVKLFKELMEGYFYQRKINVRLYISGKFVQIPFKNFFIFSIFPMSILAKAMVSFVFARIKGAFGGFKKTERLDEWIIQRFGKVLYQVYFGPYIERIQKQKPEYLSNDLGEKKIKTFSIRHLILVTIFGNRIQKYKKFKRFADVYYLKYGFGKIADILIEKIKNNCNEVTFYNNEKVQEIQIFNNEVVSILTNKRTISTEDCYVVSSIPLNSLLSLTSELSVVLNQSGNNTRLEYTKMRFLLIKVKKEKVMGYSWINFNDDKYPYYRVSENVNDEASICPPGMCSLTFEIPLNQDDKLWTVSDEELLEIVLPLFNEVFTLKQEDIIDFKSLRHDYAIPRMNISYKEDLTNIFKSILKIKNLYSIGRQGLFTFANVDHCLDMGMNFASSIIEGEPKNKQIELLKSLHKIQSNELN